MSDKGIYIYADESGHSGKEIFNKQSPTYHQGAVLITQPIDDLVSSIIDNYCSENNLDRLHGFELGEERTTKLCNQLLDALEPSEWEFHYTTLEKRYIAPTKFVDTVFDCWDNPAVPKNWYITDIFRHTICLTIDSMMHDDLDKQFWGYYLADDLDGLISICRELKVRAEKISDKIVKQVISESLEYAIDNPGIFTLISAKGKSAYKKQTPNMIAFFSLMNSIHTFSHKYKLDIKQFIHDQTDEFRGTMREFHRTFFNLESEDTFFGGIPLLKDFSRDIGSFMLESSKNNLGLQVADLFLWLLQRESPSQELLATRQRLLDKSVDFTISRKMSILIVEARTREVMSKPLTQAELVRGKKFRSKMEKQRLAGMSKRI